MTEIKMAGIAPGHFFLSVYLSGAVPGGGGGNDAYPSFSNGVMSRKGEQPAL